MTADALVAFARVLFGTDGLRESTEKHLRKLAEHGPEAKLGLTLGDGKTTALALYFVATGKINHDRPRHERRIIVSYADRILTRKKALAEVA